MIGKIEMAALTVLCKGIECDACAGAITRSLGKLAGVTGVVVDVDSKAVEVHYRESEVAVDKIRGRLAGAGFECD